MNITIVTSEPDQIDLDEVRETLEAREYVVASVKIVHRETGITCKSAIYS